MSSKQTLADFIYGFVAHRKSLPLSFGDDDVVRKSEHKYLGVILDFQSHIKEAIQKARHGIGTIRDLSKYVSRDVLDQIYKLYVRPYLDYGDIIYHKYDL